MTTPRHPIQPIVIDEYGTARFKANAIIVYLLDHGSIDDNAIRRLPFSDEDRVQLAQLLGYSMNGYSYRVASGLAELAKALGGDDSP